MTTSRRSFIRNTGMGLLSFTVAGSSVLMSPRDARARGAAFRVLGDDEIGIVEAFGEALAPGARENGIALFVDQQLSADPGDAMLMIKYFNVRPPYLDFYRAGFSALDGYSRHLHDKPFAALDGAATHALVGTISGAVPDGWVGPPAPLFYLALRSDAVDVVYGTAEGFERLGVPYMAHIAPPDR